MACVQDLTHAQEFYEGGTSRAQPPVTSVP